MITTKEIIDYVMESPHNTNPSVLKSLLNQHSGSNGGSIEPMIITIEGSGENKILNHTWNEIYDAVLSGMPVLVAGWYSDNDARLVTSVYLDEGDDGDYYYVTFGAGTGDPIYTHDPDSLEGWILA